MSDGQLEWRRWHDLFMPVHPQTGKHPIPPGIGTDCDGELERGILKQLGNVDGVLTVAELVDGFAQKGKKVSSVAVRECIRHLLIDHLVPIASSAGGGAGGGIWLARDAADLRKCRSELLSRVREIEARVAGLDDVIAVCQHRDQGPIARRYKDQMPEMSVGIDRHGRKKKRSRVHELIQKNTDRQPTVTDALEKEISDEIDRRMGGYR